ncbi:MAG TPA: TspO/MBR family protein [Candidatus Methylomirabilis sp.]|nr:TspO/MBR family protein [Candidatus Methylomirabilis sp.]
MPIKKIGQLILAIGVCEFVGVIGSVFTFEAIPNWYSTLQKPALNPPSWVFAPAWTMLYALMGISVFLMYQKGWKRKEGKRALVIFGVQLFLNAIWSLIFFGLRLPGFALVDILLLWIAILVTIITFEKISKPAAWLLLPYLLWVSFAAYLNFAIFYLNQ